MKLKFTVEIEVDDAVAELPQFLRDKANNFSEIKGDIIDLLVGSFDEIPIITEFEF